MTHLGRIVRMVVPLLPVTALLILGDVEQGSAEKAPDRSAKVVAKVGNAVITLGELERRLGAVPPFQLRVYGSNPEDMKRNFLNNVLVPELLYAQGAKEQGKHEDLEVRARQRDLLRTSLMMQIRKETSTEGKVTPEQIAAYYKQNIDRYQTPARVSVWRIFVENRETAEKLIQQAKSVPTPKAWSELAKQHSLDKSTSLRGGNLGFLTEDGTSADGKTKVPAEIAKAAFGVRDGEIVSQPVPEGTGFAVVWRRGSMPAISRSLQEEGGAIEKILLRDRTTTAQEELLERLRKQHVQMMMPDGTELIAVSGGGEIEVAGKPGRIVRSVGRTQPVYTPRGLR